MRRHNRMVILLFTVAGILFVSGCNFTTGPDPRRTPTVDATALVSATFTEPPSPTPSPSPSATNTSQPTTEAISITDTPLPPTETPTAVETLGPYIHVIKQGETLGYIIQLYGYTDFGIIPEIVRINDNIVNADTLPGEGSEIKIPRQTATPPPEPTAAAVQNTTVLQASTSAPGGDVACYIVEEGDTIVGIAEEYNMTLEQLSQLNRDLNWFGCDFGNYSGGPDCNPNIQIGQCINVYAPTPTPTLSPTPSGNETATPTPTFMAPLVVYPPDGAVVPAGGLSLQWVGVGVLAENEYYLVLVTDLSTGAEFKQVTRETSIELPESMLPVDGQTHTINWQVSVASPDDRRVFHIIGGAASIHSFEWQSR